MLILVSKSVIIQEQKFKFFKKKKLKKLLLNGEGMTLLIREGVNLVKGIFLVGEFNKFLAAK